MPTSPPETAAVRVGAAAAWAESVAASASMSPVRPTASTRMNSPATSGSTAHDTSLTTGHGERRRKAVTASVVATPSTQVGAPSGASSAETTRSASAVTTMPPSAVQPPADSLGCGTAGAQVAASRRPSTHRKAI